MFLSSSGVLHGAIGGAQADAVAMAGIETDEDGGVAESATPAAPSGVLAMLFEGRTLVRTNRCGFCDI